MKLMCTLLLLATLLALGGCGLGDYQKNMDEQRARVKLFDDESRLLGDAIEPPMDKGKEGEPEKSVWPFDVYLRLPAIVGGNVIARYQKLGVTLGRYTSGSEMTVYVAAGLLVERNKEGIYKPGEFISDDFRTGVRSALKEAYQKQFDFTPARLVQEQPVREQRQPASWRGESLPALDFDKYVGSDKENTRAKEVSAFEMYVYRIANRQVAIVYQMPERVAKDQTYGEMVDFSLKSLDISDSAAGRRSEYQTYAGRRGKK